VTTIDAGAAAELVPGLQYGRPFWTGRAHIPFWGEALPVTLKAVEGDRLVPRQVRILREMLAYPHDLRPAFDRRLFDYYQQHVYGCIDFGPDDDGTDLADTLAPRLDTPGDIWKLINGPELWIRWCCKDEHEAAVEFELDFTCTWDDEHGLGVRYRDWEIVYIGGYGG
jgi:hypothetical protein